MRRTFERVGPWDVLALLCFAVGVYHGISAAVMHGKAALAPVLIAQAWQQTLHEGQTGARPWPWADTWPVGRLQLSSHGVDLPILAGDSGNVLAFAPGHAPHSSALGGEGLAVVGGHRDTHFAFLQEIEVGEPLQLQLPDGAWHTYRVTHISIADSRTSGWSQAMGGGLLLVTCYPFDALRANGPLRYLVHAQPATASFPKVSEAAPEGVDFFYTWGRRSF